MPEKKSWSPEEDHILKHLFEEQKIKKWSTIAHLMVQKYKLPCRNGKQCKQRYQELNEDGEGAGMLHASWTLEEQLQMNQLHDQIGNKWALIAQKMEGRTDNCVKNHFYSKLRKSLRKLNKVISKKLKKEVKQIRPTVLYKVIEATDEHFKDTPSITRDTIDLSRKLKTELLQYSNDDNNEFENNLDKLKQLALDVHTFNRNYKRKPKKARRGTVQAQNLMSMPKIEKFKCMSDDDDDSNYELGVSEEESIQIAQNPQIKVSPVKNQQPQNLSNSAANKDFLNYSQSSFKLRRLDGSYFNGLKSQENPVVEAFLKNAGVLEDVDVSQHHFMKHSMSDSSQFDFKEGKQEKFNLNESMDRLRYSIILKQDPQIDQENKLFKST